MPGVSGQLPAGTYVVETDEELIPGLSFTAFRRVRTTMIVPANFGGTSVRQLVDIDPEDLTAALLQDQQ